MKRRLLVSVAVLTITACLDSGAPPRPGVLTGTIQSSNGAEGAAVLLLLGDGVLAVRGAGGTEVHSAASTEGIRAVLINAAGGVLTFEVEVVDVGLPPGVVFREVAGTDDELRDDVSAYRVGWSSP